MSSVVLSSLYAEGREIFVEHLLQRYRSKGYVIVNFLYFSNAMHWRLFEQARTDDERRYKQALLSGDFLLPDGIALQVYNRALEGLRLSNLNGTDLTPYLLDQLSQRHDVSLYISSVYDPTISKDAVRLDRAVAAIQQRHPRIRVADIHQCEYSDRGSYFPFEQMGRIAEQDTADIKIFLHCTGTPYQELWSYHHRDWLERCGFLLLNAGGLVDFYSGFEQRAPSWAVKAKVLETFYRVASNPRKNLKKFLRMFGIVRLWRDWLFHECRCLFSQK